MAFTVIPEQFFTYDGRVDSFQSALSKRRASNAHSKAPKSLKWPHSFLSAEEMAKAGFFHYPTAESPDNTICFLCRKSIVGWEYGDEPHKEHLKHSPNCGWAIVASINASDEDLCEEYPLNTRMVQARMATFGDRWPHESKKGWKCKIKQLVDAGWKYTPTLESDDMATCTYCELALDGWEPSDKPLDEHHKRSPGCSFFSLITEYKQKTTPKKATRGRKPRASKASRLSTQSTFTTTSEAPSFADAAAEEGDSIVTTATSASMTTKAGKGKKTAAKGKKPKAKNEEPLVEVPAPEPEDDDFSVKIELPKLTRGRKRGSEAMDESSLVVTQPPPMKRRATRTRGSIAIEEPLFAPSIEADVTMTTSDDLALPKKGRKTRGSNAKSVRNISSASIASQASLRMHALDDEEIDKILEADLERPLTDDEGYDATAGNVSVKVSTAAVRKTTRGSKATKSSRDMFGIDDKEIDEAAILAELKIMEVEESKPLPKVKGTKGKQARKPSAKQQATVQKAAEAAVEAQKEANLELAAQQPPKVLPTQSTRTSDLPLNVMSEVENDSENETDASMASQSTVIKGGTIRRGSSLKNGKSDKKTTSINFEEIVHKSIETFAEEPLRKQLGRSKKVIHLEDVKILEEVHYPAISISQNSSAPAPSSIATKSKGKEKAALLEPRHEIELVPAKAFTPKHSAKELTPTPSPQSSDAENHPPSSKPSKFKAPSVQSSRIPLVTSTPTQTVSPSKRNILAGLQSSTPWTPMDLDEIFTSTPEFGNEKFDILKEVAENVKDGKLTSPEKLMSVEEWIVFNASLAEEKLRRECETMVGVFEREGGRALATLEGIECNE